MNKATNCRYCYGNNIQVGDLVRLEGLCQTVQVLFRSHFDCARCDNPHIKYIGGIDVTQEVCGVSGGLALGWSIRDVYSDRPAT